MLNICNFSQLRYTFIAVSTPAMCWPTSCTVFESIWFCSMYRVFFHVRFQFLLYCTGTTKCWTCFDRSCRTMILNLSAVCAQSDSISVLLEFCQFWKALLLYLKLVFLHHITVLDVYHFRYWNESVCFRFGWYMLFIFGRFLVHSLLALNKIHCVWRISFVKTYKTNHICKWRVKVRSYYWSWYGRSVVAVPRYEPVTLCLNEITKCYETMISKASAKMLFQAYISFFMKVSVHSWCGEKD